MALLKVIIDRFENKKAVLVFEDGSQLIIDQSKLCPDFKAGDALYLALIKNDKLTGQKYKLVQEKLNELVNKQNEIT